MFLGQCAATYDSSSVGAGENKIPLDTVYHPSAQAIFVFGMGTVR